MKKIIYSLLTIVLLTSSTLSLAKSKARFDGIYKVGSKGDYQFTYVRLGEDKTIQTLQKFKNGDKKAIEILINNQANDGWKYNWSKRSLSFYKNTEKMNLNGRFRLTKDGFIKNSVFLVLKEGEVIETIIPESQKVESRYQFLTLDGKPISSNKYEKITHVKNTSNFIITSAGKSKIVNNKLENLSDSYDIIKDFQEGFAGFYNGGKWGILNQKGEVSLKANYQGIKDSSFGVVGALTNERWDLFDSALKRITDSSFFAYKVGSSGLIAVKDTANAPWRYLMLDGTSLPFVGISHAPFFGFKEYQGIITKEGYLLLDENGKAIVTINSSFKSVWPLSETRFIVSDLKGQFLIVDNKNEIVKGPIPAQISAISGGLIKYKIGKLYGLLDINGEVLIKAGYRSIADMKNGYLTFARFGKNGSYSQASDLYEIKSGRMTNNTVAFYGGQVTTNYLKYYSGNAWGIVNVETNSMIIPPLYRRIEDTNESLFIATPFKGKYKSLLLDGNANIIYQSKYVIKNIIEDDFLLIYKKGKIGLMNYKNNKILLKPAFKKLKFASGLLFGSR